MTTRGKSQDLSEATISQLLVPVTDLERAIDFYRDVLGLRFLFSAPPQMSFFQCGDVRLLVGVPASAAAAQRGSQIYFGVTDIHGIASTLKRRGVKFDVAPHVVHRTLSTELWLAEFKDPDGNQLALMCESAIGTKRAEES